MDRDLQRSARERAATRDALAQIGNAARSSFFTSSRAASKPGSSTHLKVVIKELKKLRKKIRLGGLSVRDMIEEGRRF